MAKKTQAQSSKAAKTSSKKNAPPTEKKPAFSPEQKAAIKASTKMSRGQYDGSEHAKHISYDDARATWGDKPASMKVVKGAKESKGDDAFKEALETITDIKEFNKLFDAHFKGKSIIHKATGSVITPEKVRPSKIDTTKMALVYKLQDTTGGVQLSSFFRYLEIK